MCGIVGFCSNKFYKENLKLMLTSISHRGPDDEGIYNHKNVWLGHRRLSILDLSSLGHQPMISRDERYIITYNGEVYNFKKIKEDLINKGYEFNSNTDTEVILNAFIEWGIDSFKKLDGMFAFVIYDKKKEELYGIRDRYGIKPFYYITNSDGFFFSSEMKAFTYSNILKKREINFEVLDLYLTLRYVPGNKTMLKGVNKLMPGHFLKYSKNSFENKKYASSNLEEKNGSNLVSKFDKKFSNAISKQMVSDVEVGAFLSGGLDSSYIVSKASKISKGQLKTFSAGFKRDSELPFAQKVSDKFNTTHKDFTLTSFHLDELKKIIWYLDEPIGDAAVIPTYKLSSMASKDVKVVLSGEGADEFLGGYKKYKTLLFLNKFRWIGKYLYFFIPENKIQFQRLKLFMKAKNFNLAYFESTGVFSSTEKKNLLKRKLKNNSLNIFKENVNLNDMLMFDINNWLVDDLFLKNDKMTMAHSLESRVPFLDNDFIDFVSSLPLKLKIKGNEEKIILRRNLEKVLPEISKREKHGFNVPTEDLLEIGKKILTKKNIEKRNIFKWDFVKRLLERDMKNGFYRRQFICILMFELWCEVFIDEEN